MSKTKNYNLYLEGDATTKFKEWREKLNGLVNSNMEIIDEVLGAKADQCKPFQLCYLHQLGLGMVQFLHRIWKLKVLPQIAMESSDWGKA